MRRRGDPLLNCRHQSPLSPTHREGPRAAATTATRTSNIQTRGPPEVPGSAPPSPRASAGRLRTSMTRRNKRQRLHSTLAAGFTISDLIVSREDEHVDWGDVARLLVFFQDLIAKQSKHDPSRKGRQVSIAQNSSTRTQPSTRRANSSRTRQRSAFGRRPAATLAQPRPTKFSDF